VEWLTYIKFNLFLNMGQPPATTVQVRTDKVTSCPALVIHSYNTLFVFILTAAILGLGKFKENGAHKVQF